MPPRARTEYEIGVKDDSSRTLAKIDAGFTKVHSSVLALGALGAGAAAGAFLTSRTIDAVNLADQLNKASQRTGVAVEALSQYQYAAELSDVSNETLNSSLAKLARNMDEAAQGTQEQAAAFAAIGVAVKNADGTLRATQDVFDDIAVAMGRLPDGATKTALAMALFGRAGAQLIPLLNGNADGFEAVRKEADKLGVTFSGELAVKSEELKDNLTRLDKAGSALGITLASDIVPGLADFTAELVANYNESSGLLRVWQALGSTISRSTRGSDQQRLGELLAEEIDLEQQINRLQQDFSRGAEGKLVYVLRLRALKSELESVRKEAEGLRAVMQPEEVGAAPRRTPPDTRATDEERKAAEARVRAQLDAAEATKKRAQEEEKLRKSQEGYLADLERQRALEGDATNEARVLWEIKFGKAKEYTEEVKAAALEHARELDILQGSAEVHQALNGYVRERAELEQQAADAMVARRQEVIDSLMTPLEKYTERVQELLDLGFQGDTLQRGIKDARNEMEAAQKAANKLNDTAKDLGFTFSSAAENAIVKWQGVGPVLEGLAEDILRIFVRTQISEPAGNLLSSAFGNLLGSFGGSGGGGGFADASALGLFGNAAGGLYRVGGSGAEHPVAFRARAGEYVAVATTMQQGGGESGGLVINVHNYGPQQDITAQQDGRTVDLVIGSSLQKSVGMGRMKGVGLRPALATR